MKQKWLTLQRGATHLPRGEESLRRAGIHANTGRRCSCALCGNPRRFFGEPSIQERRAAQPLLDEPDRSEARHDGVGAGPL